MASAKELIAKLDLQPHPEGGWYRETWRAPTMDGERASSTAIHFLLERGQRSHWHRIDAAEIWLWHTGDPLLLSISQTDSGPINRIRLGMDILAVEQVQCTVPCEAWQAAETIDGDAGYALVSCVVAPGFEFSTFELAPDGWEPRE